MVNEFNADRGLRLEDVAILELLYCQMKVSMAIVREKEQYSNEEGNVVGWRCKDSAP